jgi:ribosome-associated toxin RatA of RatAB toxin-antitoxin module
MMCMAHLVWVATRLRRQADQLTMMIRKATAHFAETELDDEIVLMNIDTGSFHALKGTGLAIWKLIDGTRDADAINSAMMARYDVDSATCSAEIGRFVDQMAGAGFVEHT